jgi:preprotein translocase subunit SecG
MGIVADGMSTFDTILMMLLVVDALALAALVLLQQGRGADVGAAFGSGSSNTMFGSAGSASFLTKLTVWLAIGFFLISFGLAYTAKERAAGLEGQGVPNISAPVDPSEVADPGQLTPEPEGVDSDVPDV